MVQDELCRHSQISHVDYTPHTYFETHHWLKSAVLLKMAPEEFAGGRTYDGYGSRRNAKTYLTDCIRGNVPDFVVPQDDKELVFSGWEHMCHRYARPVFFEKSPQYLANWAALSLILEWIDRTEHEVKIIGLVRNPLSVQYSAQQLFHTDPKRRQFGWLDAHRNLFALQARLQQNNFHLVRYEELIAAPGTMFAQLQQFIGVDVEPQVGASVHHDSVSKWRHDPDFDLQLDPAVKQMAARLGYSEDDLTNEDKPGRSSWGKLRHALRGSALRSISLLRHRVLRPVKLRFKDNG
jgi:hypothetical protein